MMGFARTYSVALVGLRGHIVEVEADVSSALPSFVLPGLWDTALNESKERVRSAAKNSGIGLTQHRLTINLTPATLPKKGSGFDVAMVVAALQAEKKLKPSGDCVFLGEVGLDGSIRPIPGILPAVKAAADAGHSRVVVPAQNMHEAALIPGIQVSGFRCLAEIFVALGASAENLKYPPESVREQPTAEIPEHGIPSDMSDVAGQAQGRFALEIAAAKKNVRVLEVPLEVGANRFELKRVGGGLLVQTPDIHRISRADLKVVSKRQPTEQEWNDLLFVWNVAKYVKSNAIVFGKGGQTYGIGAGQMSRVDSTRIAARKAQDAGLDLNGACAASDAFFPFRDGVDVIAEQGIKAIIHPAGSMRDQEVFDAADEHGIAMVVTGVRHFRH